MRGLQRDCPHSRAPLALTLMQTMTIVWRTFSIPTNSTLLLPPAAQRGPARTVPTDPSSVPRAGCASPASRTWNNTCSSTQALNPFSVTAVGKSSPELTRSRCIAWSTKVNAVSGARYVVPLSLPSGNINTTCGFPGTLSASLGFTSAKHAAPCSPTLEI